MLLDNDVDSPLQSSTAANDDQAPMRTCPLLGVGAPKSALNEHSCVISHGCTPYTYSDDGFELNSTTLRAFFRSGNNFVYAIDSLPLPKSSDPCRQKVRFRTIGTCKGRATNSLSADTRAVLTAALRSSLDENPYVRDVKLSNADRRKCKGAKGAIIDVDGECWQHTHSDQLNVYDFTLWSMAHGGNVATAGFVPIKQVAWDGEVVLHFPDWHDEGRWTRNANQPHTFLKAAIGRLGDRVTMNDLPRRIQSTGFARAMGIRVHKAGGQAGVEICGSPGEVANDPTYGQRMYFGKERYSQVAPYMQQEVLKNFRPHHQSNKRQIVHTMTALASKDELRQRVSWELSKIFVVADFGSAVLGDHAEVWTAYYDIFVRNAFGSFRDILREVSFNPVMARYLTFYKSSSFAFKGSAPDQNYGKNEFCAAYSCSLWDACLWSLCMNRCVCVCVCVCGSARQFMLIPVNENTNP